MKNQELTLLYVFDAIMTEASVTRAAERLGMTQPAVSNAISRMRDIWHDPLFTRKGRQIEPTAFALSLWAQVRDPMHQLCSAIDSKSFDPAKSRRQFRIAMTDLSVDLLWLPLMREVSRIAPMVDLYAVPFTQVGAVDQLHNASIDLALEPAGQNDHSLRSTFLYRGHFKLVMREGHPLAGRKVSLSKFLAARHLLVSRSGDPVGRIDRALQEKGLKRRVALTVNHFSVVPELLRDSDLIAVVPQLFADNNGARAGLSVTDPPVSVEPVPIYLLWHTRQDRDPGLLWLRELLEQIVQRQYNLKP